MIHSIDGVEIVGQERLKRASTSLESWESPVLLVGPVGSGKSLLGRYLVSRLGYPPLRDDVHLLDEMNQRSLMDGRSVLTTSYPRRVIPEMRGKCLVFHLQRYEDHELELIYRDIAARHALKLEPDKLSQLLKSGGQNLNRAETEIRMLASGFPAEEIPDIGGVLEGLDRTAPEKILVDLMGIGGSVPPSYLWEGVRNFFLQEEVARITGRSLPRLPTFQTRMPDVVDWLATCPFQTVEEEPMLHIALLRLFEKLHPGVQTSWSSPYATPRRMRRTPIPEGRGLTTSEVAASIRGESP